MGEEVYQHFSSVLLSVRTKAVLQKLSLFNGEEFFPLNYLLRLERISAW